MQKTNTFFCVGGSILLLVTAVLHGSGLTWIHGEVEASNAPQMIKDIFPILFIQVSIQLFGLAMLGIATPFLSEGSRLILGILTALILANVAFSFYLGAIVPGILLLAAAACFVIGGFGSFSKAIPHPA